MTTSLPKTTAGPETAVIPAKQSESRLGQLRHRPEAGALIGTLSVFVFFAIFGGEKFLAQAGAASWLNIAAELGIIAIPVGLLMIAGELDVSVGSVLAGSSMTLAIVSGHWGAPMIVGIVLALALGLLTGLLNGILVTRSNVPSLVVTLATLFALSGLTLGLSRFTTGTTSVALAPRPHLQGDLRTTDRRPVRGRDLLVDRRGGRRHRAAAGHAVRQLDLRHRR